MKDASVWTKVLRIFFIFALISSITLNFYQKRVIKHQDLAVEHLFEYKKGFIKVMEMLKVPPKDAQLFLKRVNEEK